MNQAEKLLQQLTEKRQKYLDKCMAAVQDGGAYSQPYYKGYCDALEDVIKTMESLKEGST